jgi:hypothetical protein
MDSTRAKIHLRTVIYESTARSKALAVSLPPTRHSLAVTSVSSATTPKQIHPPLTLPQHCCNTSPLLLSVKATFRVQQSSREAAQQESPAQLCRVQLGKVSESGWVGTPCGQECVRLSFHP